MRAPIETTAAGATICTGEGITMFRLLALRGAVKLEKVGLKRRGPSASSIARVELGLRPRASHADILAALQVEIDALAAKLEEK